MALEVSLEAKENEVRIVLAGELDAASAPAFQQKVEEAAGHAPQRLVIVADELEFMASAGLRVLIFARQKMGEDVAIHVAGARETVLRTLRMTGFDRAVHLQDKADG
jgi:anti-anti-sigma factor